MGMYGKSKFLGLRGTRLNIVIGLIAGLDFLLFGYDQGVTGGLLNLKSFIKVFPAIDASSDAYKALPVSRQNHITTLQGVYRYILRREILPQY